MNNNSYDDRPITLGELAIEFIKFVPLVVLGYVFTVLFLCL